MRIAVFIKRTTFHKRSGGMETQNKVLCEGLVAKGHNVTVISPQWYLERTEDEENGVKYVFIPSTYKTLLSKLNKNDWFKKSLEMFKKLHSESPFDLVVSQSAAGTGIIKVKEELEIPVIVISHGSIMSELRTRFMNVHGFFKTAELLPDTAFGLFVFFTRQREFIHGADIVVTVSNYVKNALMDETYAPEDKFRVVHNGIDFSKFGEIKPFDPNMKPTLLFTSRVEKEKGSDVLYEIAKDDRFSGVRMDIFGTGPQENELKSQIEESGLSGDVIVHGKVSYETLLKEYSANKIYLLPTNRIEGFPMVLPEAMYAGCPVVAVNLGGVSDAIIDGETGFLVEPGDVNVFKSKVLELLQNMELRREMSENARIKAQRDFSIQTMIEKYVQVFKEVIDK